jgi:hypothetical protein
MGQKREKMYNRQITTCGLDGFFKKICKEIKKKEKFRNGTLRGSVHVGKNILKVMEEEA